ncbi:MAG: M48 family metallopeptidase [Hyphomicrobiales bacterium]
MPSEPGDIYQGQFFDGQSAVAHSVTVRCSAAALTIGTTDDVIAEWTYDGLLAPDPVKVTMPARITHSQAPYARLVVEDPNFAGAILERAPHLSVSAARRGTARIVGLCFLAAVAIAGALYLFLTFAPQSVARILSDSWRSSLGGQIEKMLVRSTKHCTGAEGLAALNRIGERLRPALPEGEAFEVHVYNLSMINAFALPGGKIVFSGKLIASASGPEAVAGVMAHEMGHVIERHSEAQMVRALGLSMAQELLFAGSSRIGDAVGGLAGYLAIVSYTRDAERQADAHARAMLERSGIDPKGLIRFFEFIKSKKGGASDDDADAKESTTSLFSTHPGLSERIEALKTAPEWPSRPVLSEAEWTALKAICS